MKSNRPISPKAGCRKRTVGSLNPADSVSASDVQKILDRTDWQKYWSDVNEAASKEIEAYEQAEARSKRTNRFIR